MSTDETARSQSPPRSNCLKFLGRNWPFTLGFVWPAEIFEWGWLLSKTLGLRFEIDCRRFACWYHRSGMSYHDSDLHSTWESWMSVAVKNFRGCWQAVHQTGMVFAWCDRWVLSDSKGLSIVGTRRFDVVWPRFGSAAPNCQGCASERLPRID